MSEIDLAARIADAPEHEIKSDAPHPTDVLCARLPLDDHGNAKRLLKRANGALIYVRDSCWHVWDGRRFHPDGGTLKEPGPKASIFYCDKVLRGLDAEILALEADPDLKPLRKQRGGFKDHPLVASLRTHRKSSGNLGKILAGLQLASWPLTRRPSDMDPDIYLFNVENGTLRLQRPVKDGVDPSVKLQLHSKGDLITRLAKVRFDPKAQAPVFRAFLERIIPDPATRIWLQKYFGYCLTGDTEEQVFAMMVGMGANGKSTLTETILSIMGDYATTVPRSVLLNDDRRDVSKATPELAALTGVRMVAVGETSIGDRLDEGVVKNITGGEAVTARKLYKDVFTFQPQFKIAWSMNNKPKIWGKDEGIWRRVVIVPFDQQIPLEERDPHLKDKLLAEASGILNWLLDGFRMWAADGIAPSDEMQAAHDAYRQDQDPIGTFLADYVVRDVGAFTTSKKLYEIYGKACRVDGIDPMNQNVFGRNCTAKGWESKKGGKGVRGYKDMALDEDQVEALEASLFELNSQEERMHA